MRSSVRVAQDDMRDFLLKERKEGVAKTTVRFAMRLVRGQCAFFESRRRFFGAIAMLARALR